MLVITAHVAREPPLHEVTEPSLVRSFEHEVKVIRHASRNLLTFRDVKVIASSLDCSQRFERSAAIERLERFEHVSVHGILGTKRF